MIALRPLHLALALCSSAALAQDAKPPTSTKPSWNVNQPPGQARSVNLDVRSGTWMSVDVSPDGKQIGRAHV